MEQWFRWYIRIVNRLGFRKESKEFNLFKVDMCKEEFGNMLRERNYFYNDFSTTFKGQRYTVRKIVDTDHQIHLRYYSSGVVTGHYELGTWHPTEHWRGIDLRTLTPVEVSEISDVLGITERQDIV